MNIDEFYKSDYLTVKKKTLSKDYPEKGKIKNFEDEKVLIVVEGSGELCLNEKKIPFMDNSVLVIKPFDSFSFKIRKRSVFIAVSSRSNINQT